ncbi:hypothetical protein B0H13DRAFT_2370979 [Mycena leptocephala]|nr:hypothetical protein B0H13DRAFT_2370979 [Mycena leptocephala]
MFGAMIILSSLLLASPCAFHQYLRTTAYHFLLQLWRILMSCILELPLLSRQNQIPVFGPFPPGCEPQCNLVPAIQHVYNVFGNARDAESGQPLFNKTAWQKTNAVLELAREGYPSGPVGVMLYEKAGVDEHGLEKFNCRRGTNKVEGGPHGDIHRKFGALHAAPRLTVTSLTDHRTHFNLQALAKHIYGVDWEYHHDLALINRTSFLLNYLSDVIDGADSYADWMNADLRDSGSVQFQASLLNFISAAQVMNGWLTESLRIELDMELYDENTAGKFKLNSNNY